MHLKTIEKKAREMSEMMKDVSLYVYRLGEEYSVSIDEPKNWISRFQNGVRFVNPSFSFDMTRSSTLDKVAELRRAIKNAISQNEIDNAIEAFNANFKISEAA